MPSYQIKQSSTAYPLVFLMVDSSDHITPKTGLSPTVTISKAGGTFSSPSGAVTEIGSGWYKVAGNATDSATLGPLVLHATATGADPCDALYEVVAHDVQDATSLGLSRLDAAISSRSTYAGADTSGTTTLLSRVTDAVMLAASYSAPPSAATVAAQVRIELATELARIDAAISSRLASGSYTSPLDAAGIRAAIGLALANLDTQLAALAAYVDTEVASILAAVDTEIAAIKAKTDNLPSDPADASDINAAFSTVNSTLATIAGYIDTEVGAIKTKTDQLTFTVTGRVDATASGGDATAANQTTIINHLVAIKGGGFSGSTDSLEAISDAVAGLAVSSGSGAYTITITVNDGTTALQGAIVRVTEGVTTITGTTNASGVVMFALDAASWSLAITKPGYSYTPTTLTVSGTASFTRSMTAVTPASPASPTLSTGTIVCYGTDGLPESGAKVYVVLETGPGDAGSALDGAETALTANGSGVATHTGFVRGAVYKARRGTSGTWKRFTVPDAASFDIAELIGSP